MKKTVLVVDLDGTLFSINTFHYFIKFLIKDYFKKFKLFSLLQICLILFLRLVKLSTHSKMKYSIIKQVSRKDIDFNSFVDSIASHKNNIPILKEFFNFKILATAAPNNYSEIISKNENFHICFATQFPKHGFFENFQNIREVKKEAVMSYLSKENIKVIDVLVTDHIDDLPLMKVAKRNIIVAPKKETIKQLKLNNIPFELLK